MGRFEALKQLMSRAKGVSKALAHEKVPPEAFHNKIQEVLSDKNPMYKANIHPYTPEEYSKFQTYLSPDGKSGYAIKPDGELTSVFSKEKGRGEKIIDDAVLNNGAKKLDAFDINNKLPKLYGKYMDETSRLKFADEHAPKNWDYEKLGRPDVVNMSLNPEKVKLNKSLISPKKAAAITGAIGVGSLMSPDEANAAGIETIARRLGIGLEEAAKIKQLAATRVPQSVFDENIKAIQTVSGFKKAPDKFRELGRGTDQLVYDAGENVLKVPRTQNLNDLPQATLPGAVYSQQLGPKSKLVQTNENLYTLQDKVYPIDDIIKNHPIFKNDPILNKLKEEQNLIHNSDLPFGEKNWDRSAQLTDLRREREQQLLPKTGLNIEKLQQDYQKENLANKEYYRGIRSVDDIKSDPEQALAGNLTLDARRKLFPMMFPRDIHTGNVGIDKSGKPSIFDTSRFDEIKPELYSPEMKSEVTKSYIASPEKKEALQRFLSQKPNQDGLIDFNEVTKAAGIAGAVGAGGLMGANEAEAAVPSVPQVPEKSIWDRTKELGFTGLEHLGRPSAATRSGIYSAQNDMTDLPAIGKAIKSGFNQPESAPTGFDITQNLGIENPYLGTAMATGLDFSADPLMFIPGPSKLSKLRKLMGK